MKKSEELQKLDEYLEKEPKTKEGQRLKKRVEKHRQELLVFLYDASVPADNNGTERAIRIGVIHRKISNGSRQSAGAQRFSITLWPDRDDEEKRRECI